MKNNVLDENGRLTKGGCNKINRLVKQAFGISARGDLDYSLGFDAGLEKTGRFPSLRDHSRLKYIAKMYPFSNSAAMGEFIAPDGSSLIVDPKFKKQAEIYSTLYQREFGELAEITYRQGSSNKITKFSRGKLTF